MYVRVQKSIYFPVLILFSFLFPGIHAHAQNTLRLYSPYSRITVSPGQTIDYSITVINNSDAIQSADISLSGLPRSWTHTLKSGSWNISRISVLPKEKQTLALQVVVPLKVSKGLYRFRISAGDQATLPLSVVVAQEGTYKTAFTTEQPNLEGAANSTFTFNATLRNETADTALYALNAAAPPGWNVDFKANYKQVSSVNVDANQTQNITIDIHPPDQTPAGTYKIPVRAATRNSSASMELEVAVTGSYDMSLSTPTGLLSTDITAGDEKRVALALKNTGSAPLKNIKLSFAAPANWDVTFAPQQVDLLPPGRTAEVFATIKADKNAIAGDYVTNLTAKTPEASSKASFRISVRTPLLWGWVGVLIICIALGSVYYLFRKYGRR
ncbi:NEW3 domain-containing protein [Compostibacter hankyongensis]|uniref:NEW3 domain-containing protein n=1 Tax=Compostibacter hankyongensis TaxID=1007089 RepID=A0ABP8G1L5_9BACT